MGQEEGGNESFLPNLNNTWNAEWGGLRKMTFERKGITGCLWIKVCSSSVFWISGCYLGRPEMHETPEHFSRTCFSYSYFLEESISPRDVGVANPVNVTKQRNSREIIGYWSLIGLLLFWLKTSDDLLMKVGLRFAT